MEDTSGKSLIHGDLPAAGAFDGAWSRGPAYFFQGFSKNCDILVYMPTCLSALQFFDNILCVNLTRFLCGL